MKLSSIPVIGPIIEKHETARLAKDIQALSDADVQILENLYMDEVEYHDESIDDHWGKLDPRPNSHLKRIIDAPEDRLVNAHKQVLVSGNAASFVKFLDALVMKSADVLQSYTPAEISRAASDKYASLPKLIDAVDGNVELSAAITPVHVARHLTHRNHQENFDLLHMIRNDDKLMRVFDENEVGAMARGLFGTNIHALNAMAEILETHPSLNAVYERTVSDMVTIEAGSVVRSGYYKGFEKLLAVKGGAEKLNDFLSQRAQTLFNTGAYSEIANMAAGIKNFDKLHGALSADFLSDTARHLWASQRHNAYAILAAAVSQLQPGASILSADDVRDVAENLLKRNQTLHYAQLMESVAKNPAMAGIFPKTHIVRYADVDSHDGKGRHITLLFNEKGQFAAQSDRGAARAQASSPSLAGIRDVWSQSRGTGLDMDAGYIEEAVTAIAEGRTAKRWSNTEIVPDYVRPIAEAQIAEAARPRTPENV